jgi:hypothetical protein
MAQEDGEPGWHFSEDSQLSAERVRSYKNLISELGSRVNVVWENKSGNISFIFVTGGSLLAVGAEWFKGIEYIPNFQAEDGTLIQNLDGARRLKAGAYLRKIDHNWYLLYERTE